MTNIIFNADDFGYSEGINYGILEAHNRGVLTSTTLMVTMPGVAHAVEIMRTTPSLGVGLHLNISLGEPITNGKTLVGIDGKFMKPDNLPQGYEYDDEELWSEILAQYDLFVEMTGKKPTHIDSHLFSSDKIDTMRCVCARLAQEKEIPMRNYDLDFYHHVEFIQHRSFNAEPDIDYIFDNIEGILSHEYVEVMTHPAFVDWYLYSNSSYSIQRAKELEVLTSDKIKKMILDKNITLINYSDVLI